MKEASEFWTAFEEFNKNFKNSDRAEISLSLENARSFVNGMTDGWFDFLCELEKIKKQYINSLRDSERQKINVMIADLNSHLKAK